MELAPEPEELEDFLAAALGVPGGPALGRALAAERHVEALLRRIRSATVAETYPAPFIRPPRVVVEIAGAELGAAVAAVLREEGYQAAVCGGPASLPTGRCPLVEGRPCPLVEQADVVVHALGLPEGRAVFEAQRRASLDRPNVVVTGLSGRSGHEPREELRGYGGATIVVDGPLTRERLLQSVESALQHAEAAQFPKNAS